MAEITTVITGSTSGIGKVTAWELARQGHILYILVRNIKMGEQLKQEIVAQTSNKNIHVVRCEMTDLQSVREAAEELKTKLTGINILINNAGAAFTKKRLSKDKFELTFALNHLGPFLLTNSLMPLLQKGQARIINISSEAHRNSKPNFDDLKWEHTPYKGLKAYGITKLYNIFFTKSLAEKYKEFGIVSYALHPGVVKTNIWNSPPGLLALMVWFLKWFMISPEKGAETIIYLATQPGLEKNSGSYFKKCKVAKTDPIAEDVAAQEKLWAISEKLVKI